MIAESRNNLSKDKINHENIVIRDNSEQSTN